MGIHNTSRVKILRNQTKHLSIEKNGLDTIFREAVVVMNSNVDYVLDWKSDTLQSTEADEMFRQLKAVFDNLKASCAKEKLLNYNNNESITEYDFEAPVVLDKIQEKNWTIKKISVFSTDKKAPVYQYYIYPNEKNFYRISFSQTPEGRNRLILGYYLENQNMALRDDEKKRKWLLKTIVEKLLAL